jgi:hypothetical protein
MGLPWFRQGEIIETATREAMDVIQAKTVNANANTTETAYTRTWDVKVASNAGAFALVA